MSSTESQADRIRGLVLHEHQVWAGYDPDSLVSHSMRSLLWAIDHPARGDQGPAVFSAWLDQVEPRFPEGDLLHPEFVALLKRGCEELHGDK